MPAPKKPQDRQPKAAKRLAKEARSRSMDDVLGQEIEVRGRAGTVTVTVLEDPLEWEAMVSEILAGWQRAGGIIPGEVIPLLKGIVSLEDARKIDQCRPTQRTAEEIVDFINGDDEDGDSMGDSLGESQAS